jgi:hypothetical protein
MAGNTVGSTLRGAWARTTPTALADASKIEAVLILMYYKSECGKEWKTQQEVKYQGGKP